MGGYVWRGQRPEHPCECGCGGEVPIAKRSDARYGMVKGQRMRYIWGHNTSIKAGERRTVSTANGR